MDFGKWTWANGLQGHGVWGMEFCDVESTSGVPVDGKSLVPLLTKAADHCARNGVRTYQTMREREAKQKVKTMPFLFPGQPGHDLFKAEVVRREKELKKTHSR